MVLGELVGAVEGAFDGEEFEIPPPEDVEGAEVVVVVEEDFPGTNLQAPIVITPTEAREYRMIRPREDFVLPLITVPLKPTPSHNLISY